MWIKFLSAKLTVWVRLRQNSTLFQQCFSRYRWKCANKSLCAMNLCYGWKQFCLRRDSNPVATLAGRHLIHRTTGAPKEMGTNAMIMRYNHS